MALKPCRECGTGVSPEARTCPKCGVPKPVRSGPSPLLLIGILAVAWFAYKGTVGKEATPPAGASASVRPAVRGGTDHASQAKRMDTIRELTRLGVFHRLDHQRTVPRLYVGPTWYTVPFEQKQSFAGLVSAYCIVENPNCNLVVLHDWNTGKEIGDMSSWGLKLK